MNARHGLSKDASFIEFNPTGAVQRMERSIHLNLGTEHAGHRQVLAGERPQIVHADLAGMEAEMQHGIAVEGWNGLWRVARASRRRGQAATQGDLGVPAAQQGVGNVNPGCRVAAIPYRAGRYRSRQGPANGSRRRRPRDW